MAGTGGGTIGDFQFGLDSAETKARFTESLNRELEPLEEMGTVRPDLTYSEIADAFIDTVSNYAGQGDIPATDLATLIIDAVEQLGYVSEEETLNGL